MPRSRRSGDRATADAGTIRTEVLPTAKQAGGNEGEPKRSRERNEGMRRITLLVAMVAGVLVLVSGVALAANIVGNNGPNLLVGTQQADNIAGAAGNDTINARGGNDRAFGDSGTDELNGGEGADFLNVADGAGGDVIDAGPGFDTCVRDAGDGAFINCNSVTTVP